MFRWNWMLRTLFGSRREQPKAQRPKPSVPPRLEPLEDRTPLSVSSLPAVAVASPQAAASFATVTAFVDSIVEQKVQQIAMIVQYAGNAFNTLDQAMIQEVAALQLQLVRIFGINPNTQTQSSNSGASPSDGDSGAGNSATATHEPAPQQSGIKMQPMTRARSGGDTPGTGWGFGSATVSGQAWLDNNADGAQQSGEAGLAGITVELLDQGNVVDTKTTGPGGNYQLTMTPLSSEESPGFQVHFGFLPYDYATNPGPNSNIDMNDFTAPFDLAAGDAVQKNAGLASMNVTTTDDDPNAAIPGKITLRDAMTTANKGVPFPIINPAVTFITNAQTGQQLNGTIILQKQLPAIAKSYSINGPGVSNLTVNGNGDADTIFTVNAGVTSTISGLTIMGGSAADAGGINNNGNLTLNNDIITKNQTTGLGGGILNASGAELSLQQVTIKLNQAARGGGGVMNTGTVKIYNGVVIEGNSSGNGGAGIDNLAGTVSAYSSVSIDFNINTGGGGSGVNNSGGGKFQIFDGGYIFSNTSAGTGGGVNNSAGTMTLQGVQLYVNSSLVRGGGIFVGGGNLTLTDVNIFGNNKAIEGGGMSVGGGTVKMSGGGISSNTAKFTGLGAGGGLVPGGGGGLFVSGGTVGLTHLNEWPL